MSKITNDSLTRMIYSCTHMATVGIKGLIWSRRSKAGTGLLSHGKHDTRSQ